MDYAVILIIFQLIFLEGILSIDNAAVLGAMVAFLPDDQPVHWHPTVAGLGRVINHIMGPQRTAALRAGLLGAYLGRGLMLLMATLVMQNPWLKALGAAYLIRLAFDNLGMAEENETDAHVHPLSTASFWGIVVTVELTDLVFSLDNVVAAVGLSKNYWVVVTGVAIGILMMRFAAGLFSYAVLREPILKNTAYILVLAIGVELLLEEFGGIRFADWTRFGISVSIILISLLYAHWRALQWFRPVLVWLAQGFANINELIDWALVPFYALFRLARRGIVALFPKKPVNQDSP